MLLTIIFILGVSFILYTVLGGADFGAGIVETFAGKRGEKTISKALAPVWEANHVWLILAIVILFTGFPLVYAAISTALHIPLMVVLIGIILRGSFFTFRHYDIGEEGSHTYYTAVFKVSSFITPFFLGITLGAMILGRISLEITGTFYEQYIWPWLNGFCVVMGVFSTVLFGYIASVFLIGETVHSPERYRYIRLSKRFLVGTFVMGIVVFVVAEFEDHPLFYEFFSSWPSLAAFAGVVLLIPLVFYLVNHPQAVYLRLAIGAQVGLIMVGWFAIQYPILVYERQGNHLTFYNTQAPEATLYQLLIALFVGLLLVIPCFFFLYKVFKPAEANENATTQ